jgi:hypothetical protein
VGKPIEVSTYNRLKEMNSTRPYQIQDSTLKASMTKRWPAAGARWELIGVPVWQTQWCEIGALVVGGAMGLMVGSVLWMRGSGVGAVEYVVAVGWLKPRLCLLRWAGLGSRIPSGMPK